MAEAPSSSAPLRVRAALPVAVRTGALAGILATVAYLSVYLFTRATDPERAEAMLRMYVLTIAAGRETAVLDALNDGLPPMWTFGLSVLDDFGSLMFALSIAWLCATYLKRIPAIRWGFHHFEKQAILHRAWVQRTGLAGLALLYYLPGFGAGVPLTAILAVLLRMPFRRVLPFFAVATVLVDAGWVYLFTRVLESVPDTQWVRFVPIAVVTLVVVLAVRGIWRGRHERHLAVLDFPPGAAMLQPQRLLAAGIGMRHGLLHADLDILRRHLEDRDPHNGRLLATAELMLLNDMTPDEAHRLVLGNVVGLEAMTVAGRRISRLRASGLVTIDDATIMLWSNQAAALLEARERRWESANGS